MELPENERPPYDRSDPRQAAQADKRWARMTAASTSLAMLGFVNFVVSIFKPSSKPMVWEQQTLRSGDPLGLEPDHTSTTPYAGRVTLPKA
ncbi:MAG: hypothetical protein JWM40_1585 [Frankiales bacterium]|nr:hypothetical protein [Frankiales bacterium]